MLGKLMMEKKSGVRSCCNGGAIRMMERKGTTRYSHIYPLCNIGLMTGGEKRYTEIQFLNGSSHKTIHPSLSLIVFRDSPTI